MTEHDQFSLLKTMTIAAINEVVMIEGNIKKVSKYGNMLIIIFENGRRYEQQLIQLGQSRPVILDNEKLNP